MEEFARKKSSMTVKKICIIAGLFFIWYSFVFGDDYEYNTGKADFSIKFKDELSSYRKMSVFVLPGEVLTFEILDTKQRIHYVLDSSAGSIKDFTPNKWRWISPLEKGLYILQFTHQESQDSITIHVFVMVPYDQLNGEYLNGYRIGNYPAFPSKQKSLYKFPKGFIEVTRKNEETYVSPHFKLKQFLCKQSSNYPKYIVLRERLILKLELILEHINKKGYKADTFHVMSGYRTPYYNQLIGNVKYSRHLFGGAADVFIDENPRDGAMDDLNKDGRINYLDAALVYNVIDELYGRPWYMMFVGGLGWYRKTASHGPFVHVDVRGFRARWGD